MKQSTHTYIERIIAWIIGAIIPSLIFKAGVMGAVLAVALTASLITSLRNPPHWKGLVHWNVLECWKRLAWPSWIIPFIVMIALWNISALLGNDPLNSLTKIWRTFFYVIVAGWLWFWLNSSRKRRQAAMISFLITGSIVCLFAVILFYMTAVHDVDWSMRHVTSGIIDAFNFNGYSPLLWGNSLHLLPMVKFASVAACFIPVFIGVAWFLVNQGHSKGYGIIAFIGVISALSIIHQADTQAPILGLICGVLAALWVYCARMPKLPQRIIQTAIFSVVVISGLTIFFLLPNIDTPNPSFVIPHEWIDYPRQKIWSLTWQKILEAPWFGHGPRMARTVEVGPQYDWLVSTVSNYHPHNIILEILTDTGIIGFAIMMLFLFQAWQSLEKTPRPMMAASLSGVWWGSEMVNFSFWNSWWQISFLLLIILLIQPKEINQPQRDAQRA